MREVGQEQAKGDGRRLRLDDQARRQSTPRHDMKLWKRLQNPFFLIGQGFVLGGILVFATQPESRIASASPAPLAEPIVAAATPAR